MKKAFISQKYIAVKITLFGTFFLIAFCSFFLGFSFFFLVSTETQELKKLSNENLGVNAVGGILVSGSVTKMAPETITSSGLPVDFLERVAENTENMGQIFTGRLDVSDFGDVRGEVGITTFSGGEQKIFELTRDSLVQTKKGDIVKNGIFNYIAFDTQSLLQEKKDIFMRKISGEYYLFYTLISREDTFIFAQNITYIYLFIYTGFLISCLSILLFSVFLFFLSKYLIQIFIKPIEENNIRLKEYNHNLAHEIKTPLTVMMLNLGVLEDSQNQSTLLSTREEILKIKNITDTLLFLSENFVIKKQELCSIESLIDTYIKKTVSSDLISFIHHGRSQKVYVDASMFERLLKNLIENALKYSSDGKLSIILENSVLIFSNAVETDINVSNLFDIFTQGDNSRNSEGYGLGLALVKRIVDIFGWTITLSSHNKIFKVHIFFEKR